jgi:hypothetical protein
MLRAVILNQHPSFPTSPLERVREGMLVVDEQGRRLGTVVRVRLGYPQAVSTDADPTAVSALRAVVAPVGTGGSTAFGAATPFGTDEAELPEELRQELLRAGYVEVDGPDAHGLARYIHGDRIAEVPSNTVYFRPAS